MSVLTYKDNDTDPIAKIVEDGKDKNVYIDEGEPNVNPMNQVFDEENVQLISQLLREGNTLNDVVNLLKSVNTTDDENEGKSISLHGDSKIFVYPSSKSERILIGGASGLGKSTLVANYIKLWQELNPDQEVYIFVRTTDDPAFEDIEYTEVLADDSIFDSKADGLLDLERFNDSLVIFDDMDNLQDKKISDIIIKFMGDLMSNGRKKNIWTIYVTHKFLDGPKTKVALNEAQKIIFFNGCGSKNNENMLKNYMNMNKQQISELTNLPSRWVCVSNTYPRSVIYEKGIFLL